MVHHLLRGEVIMGLHNSQVSEEDCQDQGLGDNLHPQEDSVAGVKTSDNIISKLIYFICFIRFSLLDRLEISNIHFVTKE